MIWDFHKSVWGDSTWHLTNLSFTMGWCKYEVLRCIYIIYIYIYTWHNINNAAFFFNAVHFRANMFGRCDKYWMRSKTLVQNGQLDASDKLEEVIVVPSPRVGWFLWNTRKRNSGINYQPENRWASTAGFLNHQQHVLYSFWLALFSCPF